MATDSYTRRTEGVAKESKEVKDVTECHPETCEDFVPKMLDYYGIKRTTENLKKLQEMCPARIDKYCSRR